MAQNSTPTFSVNIESLAPEVLGAGLSPTIYFSNPQSETLALGPSFQLIIDAGTASASPATEHDIDYTDVFVETAARAAATGANIIQRANAGEIKANYIEMDVENILPVGTGIINLGGHYKGWIELSNGINYLGKEQSGGTFICRDAIIATCVLPSGAEEGTIYSFIPGSGVINVVPSGAAIWNNLSGWSNIVGSGITSYSPSQYVSNGLGQWFVLDELDTNWNPVDENDVVALWDAGAENFPTYGIKGGYDLVPDSNDYFSRTTGAIPLIASGIPQYPISIVSWVNFDTTAASTHVICAFDDNTNANRLIVYKNASVVVAESQPSSGQASSAGGTITGGRWHCIIATFLSNISRSIYVDTDITGETNTTNSTISGITTIRFGRTATDTSEMDGKIAYTAILPVDLSGSGNAIKRQNIFNGADPEIEAGVTAAAIYHFDNDGGADAKGLYDLTPSGSPTAQNNLIVLRDKKQNIYHQRATTSAPTWSSGLYNGRGGAAFASASSQFLVCESTPVTVAPFQMYLVGASANTTTNYSTFWLGNKNVTNHFWALYFAGAFANDPIAAGPAGSVVTSTNYIENTPCLLWTLETSSISRAVRLNGAGEGSDITSIANTGVNRIGIGANLDLTPSAYLEGNIGTAWLKNSTNVGDRAKIHNWVNNQFNMEI